MRLALAAHDEVLRMAIESRGGWLFKHTGDGVVAAFHSARDAIDAATDAQRRLRLPVRMGLATGAAEERDGDYFGPVLNHAARAMAAGHGGQVLVTASTAGLLDRTDLLDLGEHRLRDLLGPVRLFQLRGEGLAERFPALRTIDATPGNLPTQVTSFIGREVQVKELAELVRAHRLVTLTGAGGVGKTRLAVHVAAELADEFPDGVWLIELAALSDASAVPDAVATVLGVSPLAGMTISGSLVQSLAGRRVLIVLDNCEHVLDDAADLARAIIARATPAKILATSREGLRIEAEYLWPVRPLEIDGGPTSAAVELFVERARAVRPDFSIDGPGVAASLVEICTRLDGMALAIELAAARMVSMSPEDVRGRLDNRFRLLSTSRRGLERHQTLRNAVAWSFDLLDDTEQAVMCRCAIFADGFDLASATHLCVDLELDEFAVLDVIDSLVRKSLVIVDHGAGTARYGMLETIRQFAEERLTSSGAIERYRDRFAAYFAEQAVARWELWDGPEHRVAAEWVEAEFGNLRAAHRWAVDRGDVHCAAAIAAHSAMIAYSLQRFEPIAWAEEVAEAALACSSPYAPRVLAALSTSCSIGRAEDGIRWAEQVLGIADDPRFDPFEVGISGFWRAGSHMFTGQVDRALELFAELAEEPGVAQVTGRVGLVYGLALSGRSSDALVRADEVLALAQAYGSPYWIAAILDATGLALVEVDPPRALMTFREALAFARRHRLGIWEANIARELAGVEAVYGDIDEALILFDEAIKSFHRAANTGRLAATLAHLAVFFGRVGRGEVAATLFGASAEHPLVSTAPHVGRTVEELRERIGDEVFERCVRAGKAMSQADVVAYARRQIQVVGDERQP
jgi:predicted ATPase